MSRCPQPTTFHLFPNLPLELRNKIWRFTIAPRLVAAVWHAHISEVTTPLIPPILHASHESRLEGLRYYTTSTPKIYFNYDVDTALVYGRNIGPFTDFRKTVLPQLVEHYRLLRRVSIDGFTLDLAPGLVLNTVTRFPMLEEFTITACLGGVIEVGEEREIAIANEGVYEGMRIEMMPVMYCEKNGARCMDHWWFEAWNCVKIRDVESWCTAYSVVKSAAERRYNPRSWGGQLDEVVTVDLRAAEV